MSRKIFVNLAVADVQKSQAFFSELGFTFNAQFTGPQSACMIINDDAFVMLLAPDHFKQFTKKPIADSTQSTEVLIALSANSREHVDDIVKKALATGGSKANDPQDHGFMYGWSFQDPDGHIWEVLWMDPSAVQK